MTSRIYTYQDVGAESLLLGGPGNDKLINILKACLVDGYGSKPGAGWTLAFDSPGTSKAAFQQGGGSGAFLRISGIDARLNEIDPFISMTDIETGEKGKWTKESSDFTRGLWGRFLNGPGATNAAFLYKWIVIADEKFFTIASMSDDSINDTYIQTMSFGDYDTGDVTVSTPLYLQCNGVAASTTSTSFFTSHAHYDMSPTYNEAIHNVYESYISGDLNGERCRFFQCAATNRSFSYSYHPYPDRLTGGLIVNRAAIHNRSDMRLGFHPFLYQPLNLHYPSETTSSPIASEFTQDVHVFDGKGDFAGNKVAVIIGRVLSSTRLGLVFVADE